MVHYQTRPKRSDAHNIPSQGRRRRRRRRERPFVRFGSGPRTTLKFCRSEKGKDSVSPALERCEEGGGGGGGCFDTKERGVCQEKVFSRSE